MPVRPDHFKLYEVNPHTLSLTVSLKGQFDDGPLNAALSQVIMLGVAVSKNSEPIYDAYRYMTAYRISTDPEPRRHVRINNQFGVQDLTIETPELLLAPAVLVDPTDPMPAPLDHLKCYKVTDGRTIGAGVLLADHFDRADSTTVGDPLYFCVPVEKRWGSHGSPIGMPDDHLTLYGIGSKYYEGGGAIRDQFRTITLDIVRSRMLAVPTTKLSWAKA